MRVLALPTAVQRRSILHARAKMVLLTRVCTVADVIHTGQVALFQAYQKEDQEWQATVVEINDLIPAILAYRSTNEAQRRSFLSTALLQVALHSI